MCDWKHSPEDECGAGDDLTSLRSLAEKKVLSIREWRKENLPAEEISGALHELRVHQIELEVQNEELRRAKAELIASRARFFDLYNRVPVACLTVGRKGLIAEANLAAAALFGTNLASLLNRPFSSFIRKEDRKIYYAYRKLLFKTAQRRICELRMLKRGEEMFWARLESAVSCAEDGPAVSHLVLCDISELKWAEEESRATEARVRHLNDVLRLSREVGRVINREKEPLALLNAVCTSLVKMRGYVMVWVGKSDAQSDRIVPVAGSRGDARYLQDLPIAWNDCDLTLGPAATAMRERRPVVLEDISGDLGRGAWKERAGANGTLTIASFPLIYRENLLGVLTVSASRLHAFDTEEVCLLEDLAADIAHGLQSIEDELVRLQAEREACVQKDILENIFENAPFTMMLLDKAGRVLEINRAGLAFCGRSKEESIGLQGGEIFNCVDSSHGLSAVVMATLETGKGVHNVEGRLKICRQGRESGRDVLLSTTLVNYLISKAVLLTIIDVTESKKTADALRENQEWLQMVFERAPVHLAMFDRRMRFLKVSRKWVDDYNLSHCDLCGRDLYEVLPEISEKWKSFHRRALAGEVIRMREDRFERAGGNAQWLRWEIRPWFDKAGNIGGIVVFSEDITELRNAREFIGIERDLALKLGATADMVEAMEYLLEACLQFEALDSGGIYLVDNLTGTMRLVCHRGIRKDVAERVSYFGPGSSAVEFSLRGESRYWADPVKFPEFDDFFEQEGITAVTAIPVVCNGKTVAQINLSSHVVSEIPKSIRPALEGIATHIGGVVERLKLAETIKMQEAELRETNAALKMLLKHRDLDRHELEDFFLSNVKNLILPYLDKLKKSRLDSDQRKLLEVLETHLVEIASPFVKRISAPLLGLTPMEIRIAELIRLGHSTKEIADLLHISDYGVIFHRQNIRGKLRLTGKKLNLQTFLNTLA